MIKVLYNKTCGRCVQSEPLTSGMVGQTIELEYSPDFDGLTLTAVFTNGKATVDVLNPGNQCVIPHEVLDTVGTLVKVGIYATKGNELVIPTVYATIGIVLKGADPSGDVSADPTLPVWAQIQGIIGNLNDLNTEAKNNLVAAINEAAQSGGGGGSTVELDTTLTQSGKAADAKAVGDALAELEAQIPESGGGGGTDLSLGVEGAAVGQIVKITAVDSNGKPTAWQAVDMPSGGGHWETVLDTVWQQDVINPTAYDSETGIFTCAAGELDNLELNTEYVFYSQCTKEGIAYNTILNAEYVKVTKLSDTTFSINVTPGDTFVVANVKFSKAAILAVENIDATKIRLTLDGQFKPTATLYDRPFYGAKVPYFGENVGYIQIRNAYQAYQQVTVEAESPYRMVGEILCGFHAPSNNGNYHFKHNSFCCPLVPYDTGENTYFWNADGTKIAKLYSTSSPWAPDSVKLSNDYLKIISGTKVKLERWVE